MKPKRPIDDWNGVKIPPGTSRDVELVVGESHTGITFKIPVHVRRGPSDGPVVFITAALHGDEINGAGAIRSLIQDENFQLKAGSAIMVPVLNVLGFDRHSRYLPDGRDLNRVFPGSISGSQASRFARVIFDEIVSRSDFGIDLHTAALRRTNFPSVRADLTNPEVKRLATAFGSELILHGGGPKGSFRRAACAANCPTIVLEGGEVWKVEPTIVECSIRGIRNVLIEKGMLGGDPVRSASQLTVEKSKWVRAERGGFLRFHTAPGDLVEQDQPLATTTSLLGQSQNVLVAPFNAVVIGMTTVPAASPGEPVCHIGKLAEGTKRIERLRVQLSCDRLRERVVDDLAKNVLVFERPSNQH
ncbi:MAG: succinylglutamate desuccinylase/aspartoacylase family protein [Planctomycetaceae bacterium]